jgi:hypothetical protein
MSELNETSASSPPSGMSKEALARRRMLLKSLGKGSAALAAASVPMHTLANSPTLLTKDGTRCSISGMQSGNNSRLTGAETCQGNSPDYWRKYENWTPNQKKSEDVKFGLLFGPTDNKKIEDATLKEIVCSIGKNDEKKNVNYNNTPERHWCCAWMNAVANGEKGVVNFPYKPEEVINFYLLPTVNRTRKDALNFFKLLEN